MEPAITPEQLAAILQREKDNADSYAEMLEELHQQAFDYYEAKPFGNEVDGRSQIVLPDVQTSIDHMTQSILRTFTSGDRVIEFEAEDEGDEQSAVDATAAVDYYFMRKQDGYRTLYDVLNDGLLRKMGVFKAVAEKRERVIREEVIIPVEALGMLPDDAEIEDVTENGDGSARVGLKVVKVETCFTGHAVPLNEFRFSPRAKHEDTANYVAHIAPLTRGELVEMGFDRAQVYDLPRFNDTDLENYESNNLDFYDNEETSPAVEYVELCEEYARIDVDGDGIAERVKVFRCGGDILRYQGAPIVDPETGEQALDEFGEPLFEDGELAVETVDFQPFSVFTPFPRPHKMVGYSLADKVMDIQYLRSMVARQMNDGMAFSNLPRPIVAEDGSTDETLDDILNPIPGAPIRVRSQGAVVPLQNSFNVGQSLSVLEWATGEGEKRTGITAMNQGLDADAINKTATGTALMMASGQQMEEAIAKQMAEAFGRLAIKIYRMMREDGYPFVIRVDGEAREVDPSQWPDKMHVRARVGLGTGSKDKRIQARMALYPALAQAMSEGLAGPEHAFKWMDGVARDTGIGHGDDFMFTPEQLAERAQNEEPEVDPELVKVQEDAALKRDMAMIDAELKAFEMQQRIELEAMKISGNLDLQAYRAEVEAGIARMKAQMEARLKLDMSKNREGGDLDK